MGFAVFHIEKIKASGNSLGAHIDRKEGQEHTYRNADPERRKDNRYYDVSEFSKVPLKEALEGRISQGYTMGKAIRKDAVKGLSIVLTGSHEDMKRITATPEGKKAWVDKNYSFLVKEFGKENIVRLVLHMDEKTPHLHAVVVPLKEGKLTAKLVMGDRLAMSDRQTRYAQAMEKFELKRGIVGSKAIHNGEGWYLGQQQKAQEAVLGDLPAFGVLDRLNPGPYVQKLTAGLKLATRKMTDAELLAGSRDRRLIEMRHAYNTQTAKLQEALKIRNDQLQQLDGALRLMMHEKLNRTLSPQEEQTLALIEKTFLEQEQQQKQKNDLDQQQKRGQRLR